MGIVASLFSSQSADKTHWKEDESGLYTHRSMLKDTDRSGCMDEIVHITTKGENYYRLWRTSAMKSPVVRMLLEREQPVTFPCLSDSSLRLCIEVMMGKIVTEKTLSRDEAQAFFLDELPPTWIDEQPSPERLKGLCAYHKVDYPATTAESETLQALVTFVLWRTVLGKVKPTYFARCTPTLRSVLQILYDPESFPVEELSMVCMRYFSLDDWQAMAYIQTTVLGKPLSVEIDKIVISMATRTEHDSVALAWVSWAIDNNRWCNRNFELQSRYAPSRRAIVRHPYLARICDDTWVE